MHTFRIPPAYHPPPPDSLVDIWVDDTIIVVSKPSGLLSVPGRGPEKADCVASYITRRHGESYVVHRLDMDTSGLMVLARTREAHRALSKQFHDRLTTKIYEAVTDGIVSQLQGTVDLPIAKFSKQRPLRHTDPEGQEAITHWKILEYFQDSTRVELSPETGRSHQLRLHLAEIGHPILGDAFYGDETSAKRLLLHAKNLGFAHPNSGEKCSFTDITPF